MNDKHLLDEFEKLVKTQTVSVSYDEGGGGVGLHFCVNPQDWPFCHGGNLREAIETSSSSVTVSDVHLSHQNRKPSSTNSHANSNFYEPPQTTRSM